MMDVGADTKRGVIRRGNDRRFPPRTTSAVASVLRTAAVSALAVVCCRMMDAFVAPPALVPTRATAEAPDTTWRRGHKRCLSGEIFASAPAHGHGPYGGIARRCSGEHSPSWVAQWVGSEVSQHPVVLFAGQAVAESQRAKVALQKAHIRYELVDLDGIGQQADHGASWSSLLADYLTCGGERELPVLFVGGKPLSGGAEIARLAESGELRGLCAEAGAELLKPEEPAAQLPWTPRERARWLPPKDINGRRWYQDEPNSAKRADEHSDEARIEYNINSVSPGAGSDHRGRFTGAAKVLLRQETNLDEPDRNGVVHQYPPFTDVDLLRKPDLGWSYYLRSRDLERAKNVGPPEVAREGLSKAQLMWVYSQGKKKLVEELELRQCRHKVVTTLDVQSLRDLLMDEMRKERTFSPTQLGVVPGVVQALSGPQLREERLADTNVPLLLAVVSEQSPPCVRFGRELQAAAKRALRAVRVVRVDGQRYPEVVRELGISRFPTVLWFEARTGAELAREVGVVTSLAICDRTSALLQRRALPEAPGSEALAVATAGRDARSQPSRWRVNGGVMAEERITPRWASTRSLRNTGR